MAKGKKSNWTDNDENFKYFLAADFISQLEEGINARGLKQSDLAQKLGVSESRISQIVNNPGNLTIESIVTLSRAIGLKSSIVLYDDKDPYNNYGPLVGEIFNQCWKMAGAPTQFIESFADKLSSGQNTLEVPSVANRQPTVFEGLSLVGIEDKAA